MTSRTSTTESRGKKKGKHTPIQEANCVVFYAYTSSKHMTTHYHSMTSPAQHTIQVRLGHAAGSVHPAYTAPGMYASATVNWKTKAKKFGGHSRHKCSRDEAVTHKFIWCMACALTGSSPFHLVISPIYAGLSHSSTPVTLPK